MKNYTISQYKLAKEKTNFEKVKITSSKDASEFIRKFYSDDIGIFESCFILLLDRANNTIGYAKISQGGVTGTVVDPLIVAKYAVDSLCKGVILCHNHPSGNLQPSSQDENITQKIKKGLQLFDINLFDHIILTEEGYYSFQDSGIL